MLNNYRWIPPRLAFAVSVGALLLVTALASSGNSFQGSRAINNDQGRSSAELALLIDAAPRHSMHLVPTIDGLKTPEMIPDDVAYRVFLLSLKGDTTAAFDERRIRRATLAFTADECGGEHTRVDARLESWLGTLLAIAHQFNKQLAAVPLAGTPTALLDRERIAADAIVDAHRDLGPDGSRVLDCYIRSSVKRRINYFD
jgi:hypothetical protein